MHSALSCEGWHPWRLFCWTNTSHSATKSNQATHKYWWAPLWKSVGLNSELWACFDLLAASFDLHIGALNSRREFLEGEFPLEAVLRLRRSWRSDVLTREWAKSFAVVQLSDSTCAGILQHSCNSSGMQPSPQCVWTFSDLTHVISDCMWPFFVAGKQRFHRCWENWNRPPIYLFDAVLHARSPDWAMRHWIGLSTSRLVLGECQECCHSKMLQGFGLHHLLTADFLIDCRSWRSERARVALCASFLIRISQFALFPTNDKSCCRIGFHISLI